MNVNTVQEEDESSESSFNKNNDNGLLFVLTCTNCFNENKCLSMSEKSVPTHGSMYVLIALESTLLFPWV